MTEDSIPTLESAGEFDALVKLRAGEPYFPLIARDRLAPPLVDDWADRSRKRALAEYQAGTIDRAKLTLELRQATNAEMIACEMRAYKAGHDAEVESGQAALPYTGHELPEDAAKRDALQMRQARASAAIHNSIAELDELAALLDPDAAESADTLNVIRDTIGDLKNLAASIAPKRTMPQAKAA